MGNGPAVLLATLLVCPSLVIAQTAQIGQLAGVVTDSSGGRLPGATVTITSIERGVTRSTPTDEDGKFLFSIVSIGTYDVTVSLTGFQTKRVSGNVVETDRTTNITVTLAPGAVTERVDVVGETPIVDTTNQAVVTRLRAVEFQNLPIGRSYQVLLGQAPGVVGTGNVNAHGALTSNNQFLFDGVNTTDTVTGTFGANLNYEAISEVVVRTAGVSAEYGRSTGAYVDVITKSGSNQLHGSFKLLVVNDNWDKQNGTRSEVTQASLGRSKFDHVNQTYSFTAGGPIRRNRLWYFFAYERAKTTTPQVQLNARPGVAAEDFQQNRVGQFPSIRGTWQITTNQALWVKYSGDPLAGIVRNDYWSAPTAGPAEREALTAQDQGGKNISGQYTTVIGSQWTAELTAAGIFNEITVEPFERTTLDNGAPYWDLDDNRIYNGATFDGYVRRPRAQVLGAVSRYARLRGISHDLKFGVDYQHMSSEAEFKYPNNQIFYGSGFDPVTRRFNVNDSREDYDAGPSTSKGNQTSLFFRDRLRIGARTTVELGFRVENQSGQSDIGVPTVDTTNFAPRLSGSFALTDDAKTLLQASYGRYYDGILQGYSDAFANVPQQENYSTYVWNGSSYVFSSRSEASANNFKPDTKVSPRKLDEVAVGVERQVGNVLGGGIRYIHRAWGNFIDDTRSINTDGTLNRVVGNMSAAKREYNGVELSVDKRFADRWAASGSYTYSKTTGNHFGDDFTALGDFVNETCSQTVDSGLFGGGSFPCSEVQGNLQGRPTYDRPHLFKYNGSYTHFFGGLQLTAGLVGAATSKTTYQKTRTLSVLSPLSGTQFATISYFYDPRGTDRIKGLTNYMDVALEVSWRSADKLDAGLKFETFNLTNNQEKTAVNNTTWCAATVSSACQTSIANYGTATARGSFQGPRSFRATFLIRY